MSQNENSVSIFTYHSLDTSGSVISTSPERFRRQMEDLAKSGFPVVTLREIAACLREKRAFPSGAVALTFDDGFRSVYDVALPVLKEYNFPATVFLVTDYCGKNNRWYGQFKKIPTFDLLTWDQISEMTEHNVEFGVHTATHPDLRKISSDRIPAEIVGAQETLQSKVGSNQNAFAYPYGKDSSAVRSLIESRFYAACSTEMDFVTAQSDVYFLPRIDMFYFSTNNLFSAIGTATFSGFVLLRKTLRALKQSLRSTD